ncbi:MAG: Ppx/GppA family phosphatase [Pseudomonadota bacterium]
MLQKGLSIAGLLKTDSNTEAQGRLGSRRPIAIIDIGSNSVRQVVYEGLTRSPSILFNEKILCGLGKGVAATGELDPEASARAIRAVRRFAILSKQMGVSQIHILATAAAREAKNGEAFLTRVEEVSGKKVSLLTGRQEAEFAAQGIRSGFHEPVGVAGDLGGGSMELMEIPPESGNGATTPLGGLRLQSEFGDDLAAVRKHTRKILEGTQLNWENAPKTFYAVGGTWRSLGRLHMYECDHPMEVVHAYSVDAKEFRKFCSLIAKGKMDDMVGIDEISSNRRPLLPYGAIVMEETLKFLGVDALAMSAVGLREGFLYSLLDQKTQEQDALLQATTEFSILRARSPGHSSEMGEWTGKAFDTLGIKETASQKRWRVAACNLADIVWRSASDFRAEQTLGIINNAGFNSISHEGRAYLAIATFHRYQGLGVRKKPPKISKLASEETARQARLLAALFRVLYLFTAAEEGILPKLKLRKHAKGRFALVVPDEFKDLIGERPMNRIDQLSRELDASVTVEII